MDFLGTIETMAIKYSIPLEYIPKCKYDVSVFRNNRLRVHYGKAKTKFNTETQEILHQHIQLNKRLELDRDIIRDTLAHEIAHIIHPFDGHGIIWREKAIQLGSNGRIYGTSEESKKIGIEKARWPMKVVAICENCGVEYKARKRLTNKPGWVHVHTGCGKFRLV